jgi:hypothetical protein
MTSVMSSPSTLDNSPEAPRGMSDEEELKRYGQAAANEGVGETVFDMTDDLRELGLISEDR